MIEKGKLVDEHFTQQWHWIKNLAQYYKNNITQITNRKTNPMKLLYQ